MSKLGVIDLTKPTVQIDRINETAILVDQTSENHLIDEGLFNVINEDEFILLAKSIPGVYEPEQLWNVLFGHYSHDGKLGTNPHVQYLTAAAGEQILHYWNKFQHGIDFQHLPKGFHLIANPNTQRCEVLHYSLELKEAQKLESMPLAVTLEESEQHSPELDNAPLFSGRKEECYQLLLSKIKAYCSKEELSAAFKYFSGFIEHDMGLSYDDFPLSPLLLKADINPVVLLGRWETVMSNPQLKKADRLLQWNVLTQLSLYNSHESIRALTDYLGDDNPCGFLLPEMALSAGKMDLKAGFRTVRDFNQLGGYVIDFERAEKLQNHKPDDIKILKNKLFLHVKNNKLYFAIKEAPALFKEIAIPETLAHYQSILKKTLGDVDNLKKGQSTNPLSRGEERFLYDFARSQSYEPMNTEEANFWRYIAYQPKRNSIEFYKKAIACIHNMKFKEAFLPYRGNMYKLLAACTSQNANKANNTLDENQELQIWQQICTSISDFENNMPYLMRRGGHATGQLIDGKAVTDYLHGNTTAKIYPNLEFQQELFAADLQTVYSLELKDIRNPDAKIKKIDDHRSRFALLLDVYSTDVYQGARFYRQQGEWKPLSIQDYTLLQYELHKLYPGVAALIIPHLSTFNITQVNELKFLGDLKKESNNELSHEKAVRCAMAFWKDASVNSNLHYNQLTALFNYLQTKPEFADGVHLELEVLNYLEGKFHPYFPEGYFKAKRELLENQAFDLTEEEKRQIRQYQFKSEQSAEIERIEVALKRKKKGSPQGGFAELNERFSKLRYVLPETDFNFLLHSLASLGEELLSDTSLVELIKQIQTKRTISGFTQFFQCIGTLPKVDALIDKFVFFIKDVKPFIAKLKDKGSLALEIMNLEENLALLLLHIPEQAMQEGNFKEEVYQIILTLNDIAKAHAIAKPYLLSTLKSFLKINADFKQIKQLVLDLRQISKILYAPAERPPNVTVDQQSPAEENMLTFYSLLAHYNEKPEQLMKLLQQLENLDPYLRLEKIAVKDVQKLSANEIESHCVYLKKINDESIEYILSNEEAHLQAPRLFTKDNCTFFDVLLNSLTPAFQIEPYQEKILFDFIKKQRKQSIFTKFFSYFKTEETVKFIPQESAPKDKQPSCVYLTFDRINNQFTYLVTDALGMQKELGVIGLSQLSEDEFNELKKRFNPVVTLTSDLKNKITAHLNELAKQAVDPVQKRFILRLISRLLGNQKSIAELEELLRYLNSDVKSLSLLMHTLERPPYPDIATIHQWIKEGNFIERYKAYSLQPYGRRELCYAFQEPYFHQQKTKYEGIDLHLFSDDLAHSLNKRLTENREKSIPQLQEEINQLRALPRQECTLKHKEELLCLCIEMLARTTGQKHPDHPEQIISQELNTTQVMTLYAMLATENTKLISQIDAGEGKSRIAMILAACEGLSGKTVDVLTSDLQLAERDYLTYTPFFNSIGLPTSLITINTPPELYQKSGINFSDDRQLFLLRNQSDILGKPFSYLQENKQKRCLILDEEDVFRHNKSTDLYNYALPSSRLKNFAWIYSHLVKFIQEQLVLAEQNKTTVLSLDELTPLFVQYVKKWESDAHYKNLLALKIARPVQISTWLNSAYQAIRMKEKQHYAVTEQISSKMFTVVDAHNKTRLTRKVLVVDHGRTIEDSTFAEGMHQCLCALENQKAKDSFVILPENATARSSLTTNFIAQYKEGQLYGISGSTRSDAPRFDKRINHENYHYLITPRHKPLQREDKPIWVAKDETQQIQFLKRLIIEKLKRKWPILIVCKNDNQSQTLYKALTEDPDVAVLLKKQQYIHALSSSIEKKEAIENGGEECVLTVSTVGNFARGIDIYASNEKPVLVLAPFVPSFEDEIQIPARTARNGKTGEYRMVPHLQDPDYPFKGNTGNVAREIHQLQGHMATQAAFHEEVSKLYADFLEEITQRFLREYQELKESENGISLIVLLEEWSNYLGVVQKDWQKCRNALVRAIDTRNKETFTTIFQNFADKWILAIPSCKIGRALGLPPLSYEERLEKIYTSALLQSNFFKSKKTSLKVQHSYDPSDDGQARIYDVPFAQLRAVIKGERQIFADYYAWKEGRGELFPDLMAALRGERPLFANLLATINRWIQELKVLLFTQKAHNIIDNELTNAIPVLG